MKQRIKLTEAQLRKVVTESVKKILKENEETYKYYVSADTGSEYFNDYDEAYSYAKDMALDLYENNPEYFEDNEILIMDNEEWETIGKFFVGKIFQDDEKQLCFIDNEGHYYHL